MWQYKWTENDNRIVLERMQKLEGKLNFDIVPAIITKANSSDLSELVLSLIFFIFFVFIDIFLIGMPLIFPIPLIIFAAIAMILSSLIVRNSHIESYFYSDAVLIEDCRTRASAELLYLERIHKFQASAILIAVFEQEQKVLLFPTWTLENISSEQFNLMQSEFEKVLPSWKTRKPSDVILKCFDFIEDFFQKFPLKEPVNPKVRIHDQIFLNQSLQK